MTSAPLTFPKDYYGAAPAPAASPLSPEHFSELQLAQKRSKKVRRAVLVAAADAWVSGIFAGLTILFGIFSVTSLILGLAFAAIAVNSFRGAKRLRRFDTSAPRLLAANQVVLAVIIIAYAAWSLWSVRNGSPDISAAIASEPLLKNSLGNLQQLYWIIAVAVYGGLMVSTVLAQGFAALYYATRGKHLAAYLQQTPTWVVDVQKTQAQD